MTRHWIRYAIGALAVCPASVVAVSGSQGEPPLDRRLPAIRIDLLSDYALEQALHRLGRAVDVLVGFESRPLPALDLQAREPGRLEGRLNLTNLPFREALDLLLEHQPGYRWAPQGSVVVVRPVEDESPILDARVKSFVLRTADVPDALEAVHRVFDPTYKLLMGSSGPADPQAPVGTRAPTARMRGKQISLQLTDATVSEILSAIVEKQERMTWSVAYRPGGQRTYEDCRLAFQSFDGWVVIAAAHPRIPSRR